TAIEINTIYLVENPSKKAYRINLPNIKALSNEQNQQISKNSAQKSALKEKLLQNKMPQISFDPYELDYDEAESSVQDIDLSLDAQIDKDDSNFMPELLFEQSKEIIEQTPHKEQSLPESEDENPFVNYVYNPQTASEELGLPIDLVEEFIQDFIAQANSFKSALYTFVKESDLNSLKIQSHKLKGVAANLRIEDALDALSKVNSSDDYDEIKINLDRLYSIINKLSKTDNSTIKESNLSKDAEEEFEDEFTLSIKEETPSANVEESIVPDFIESPELADDEYLNKDAITYEDISIEDEIIDEDLRAFEKSHNISDAAFTYDKNKIAHEIGLDIESFNELFEDYLNEVKVLCNSMINSASNKDSAACKSAAIKLSGMSENMRIHDFDDELKAIINSTEDTALKALVQKIISKLNLISNYKG
ncbi:MAG: Hpt domain-containing protein, partial [Sulfurimonas sp.]|nr:Hpt domain-containing protein [Sulfurimonas sp.]